MDAEICRLCHVAYYQTVPFKQHSWYNRGIGCKTYQIKIVKVENYTLNGSPDSNGLAY